MQQCLFLGRMTACIAPDPLLQAWQLQARAGNRRHMSVELLTAANRKLDDIVKLDLMKGARHALQGAEKNLRS